MAQTNCQKINQFYNTLVSAKKELSVLSAGNFQQPTRKEAIRKGIESREKAERATAEFWPFEFKLDGIPVKVFHLPIDYRNVPGKDVVMKNRLRTDVEDLLKSDTGTETRKSEMSYLVQMAGDTPDAEIQKFMGKHNLRFATMRELLSFNDANPSEVTDYVYTDLFGNRIEKFNFTYAIRPTSDRLPGKQLIYLGPLPISLVGDRRLLFVKR